MAEQSQESTDSGRNLSILAWLIYGPLRGMGFWFAASLCGFAAMALIVMREYRRGTVKIMDLTSLGYFGTATIMAATPASGALQTYHLVIVWSVFAAVAWGTLIAGFPFTMQYAREQSPSEAWHTALFRRINVTMTLVWSSIFTLGAVLGAATLVIDHKVILGVVIPGAGMVAGFIFNNRYPKRFNDQFAATSIPSAAVGEASH
jgi:hypothetical protein